MTVRGGGVPIAPPLAFTPGKRMGPSPWSFAADAHECIMVSGSWTHRIQGRGAIDPRPESGLPFDRHPDRTKRAVVLGAVKVWPGKAECAARFEATANLDSSCARQLCNTAGRGEETGLQDRGRDGDCSPPPAQTRTGPIKASGSYLEYLTAKRALGL
jgi:hypothetical protein